MNNKKELETNIELFFTFFELNKNKNKQFNVLFLLINFHNLFSFITKINFIYF